MTDPHDLARFIAAQQGVHDTALAELMHGRKRSHWMWFIFPQIAGLGRSDMAQRYAIRTLDEALAYLEHPILGPRLRSCTEAVLRHDDPLREIFGTPDDLKFLSSMTLFHLVAPDGLSPFRAALDRWSAGKPDEATLQLALRD